VRFFGRVQVEGGPFLPAKTEFRDSLYDPGGPNPPSKGKISKFLLPNRPGDKKWVKLNRDFNYSHILLEEFHCLPKGDRELEGHLLNLI
jgi:hypothetical protein